MALVCADVSSQQRVGDIPTHVEVRQFGVHLYLREPHNGLLRGFYRLIVERYLLSLPSTGIFEVYADPDIRVSLTMAIEIIFSGCWSTTRRAQFENLRDDLSLC